MFRDSKSVAAAATNRGTIGIGHDLMAAQYFAEIIEDAAHIAYARDTLMAAHGKRVADMPLYGTAAHAERADSPT